jgi:uracil-DNA glycosylase
VPGDGPTDPAFMFIGEAPGRNEAKQRRPFVGASGQLLNELLASVHLDRNDIFITNLVKYRPTHAGGNRPPTKQEDEAGYAYLRREHALLGSPPMVLLGKHARDGVRTLKAGEVLLPVANMEIGKWCWLGQTAVLPLHHPAYGIYQQANRPLLFEHFKAVLHYRAFLKESY